MKPKLTVLILALLVGFAFLTSARAEKKQSTDDQEPVIDEPAPQPTATPMPPTPTPAPVATPTAVPTPKNPNIRQGAEKALVVHKPMPNPAWGKVIQYRREANFALSEKNREVLHEFLFQDEEGIIRTAIFHENSEGGGYWEVWAWDQQ